MRVVTLPVGRGDAIVVEWTGPERTHRMLVDGGPPDSGSYRRVYEYFDRLPQKFRHVDVLVVTHIDGDHIGGVIRLLRDRAALGLVIGDVWFNGSKHLPRPPGMLGQAQAEFVGALLESHKLPWNMAFGTTNPVTVDADAVPLPGGAVATIVSPGSEQLVRLRMDWLRELRKLGVRPGDTKAALLRLTQRRDLRGLAPDTLGDSTKPDDKVANGSSIAFLLEHRGASVLLTGDGHGDVLSAGIRRLLADRDRDQLTVGAVKLPHHGSASNVTDEFLELIDTRRYVFSTNGAIYNHPDRAAIERILHNAESRRTSVELVFNYCGPTTETWAEPASKWVGRYTPRYPADPHLGAVVEIEES